MVMIIQGGWPLFWRLTNIILGSWGGPGGVQGGRSAREGFFRESGEGFPVFFSGPPSPAFPHGVG